MTLNLKSFYHVKFNHTHTHTHTHTHKHSALKATAKTCKAIISRENQKIPILISLALFLFSNLLQAQSQALSQKSDSQENTYTIDADEPIITVSDQLYHEIGQWLRSTDGVSIIEYLENSEANKDEVSEFLDQLGLEDDNPIKNKSAAQQALDCQCNSIMPNGDFDKKTSAPPLDTFTQNHWGFLNSKFWHKWVTYDNDGLGFALDVKVESNAKNNKSFDVTLSQEGSSTMRITNLCTDGLGNRDDECNCDKDILYKGGYANNILTNSDFNTSRTSGMKLALGNGYYVYSTEDNIPGTGSASFDTIDRGVWAFSLEQSATINFSTLGIALTHLANFAFDEDTDLAGRFGHLGSFISTLDTIRHIDDTNSNFNYSHVRDFDGAVKLRANVPRNFRAFGTLFSLNETEGRKANLSETNFRSIFNWNFYIPSSKATYNFAGDTNNGVPSEGCCNESVGMWEFHGKTFDTDMNFVGQQFKSSAEHFLNYDLSSGQAVSWSQSRYSSDPNLFAGGFVNLQGNDAMQFPKGQLYTVDRCNCESFLTYDVNPYTGETSINFLNPDLTLPPNVLCPGETAELFINNINELEEPCQTMEIRLNNQVISDAMVSNFNISATGNYEVSFVDTCTGCRVSTAFTITPCSSGNDDADCIRDHFSLFPNPVFVNSMPELVMQACLSSCADTTSMAAVNSWASNYFPASVTIRDISTGTIIYGPTNHFSPVLVNSNFCLQEQFPASTVSSWSSWINSNVVVTIQLLNGDSFSKIIQLK